MAAPSPYLKRQAIGFNLKQTTGKHRQVRGGVDIKPQRTRIDVLIQWLSGDDSPQTSMAV
jgi:hypothetical protein